MPSVLGASGSHGPPKLSETWMVEPRSLSSSRRRPGDAAAELFRHGNLPKARLSRAVPPPAGQWATSLGSMLPLPMWKIAQLPSGKVIGAELRASSATATSLNSYGPVMVFETPCSIREARGPQARGQPFASACT